MSSRDAALTAFGQAGLHGALNVVAMALVPELVIPRLRGEFGRPYLYARETPSTQLMFPDDAPHGAVALAEHQTAGRGRLDRTWQYLKFLYFDRIYKRTLSIPRDARGQSHGRRCSQPPA